MKIAIVHDYLNQYGGAEQVVKAFHDLFPHAPIYTSIYLPENLPETFKKMNIRSSFMQKLPSLKKHFKKYFLIYPIAFKSFDFSEYDVILSSSSAYAKAIRKPTKSLHICYCHTPARFIWRYEQYMEKESISRFVNRLTFFLASLLRKWDLNTSKRVDYFIANCDNIKKRIKTIYDRDSIIIYPPVETNNFFVSSKIKDYFLVVSRLNAYKRIDIVIEAFNQLKLPLRIIGDGSYREHLQMLANNTIEFLGKVSEKKLAENYANCKALILPGEEDFGIVPLEAQSSGRPVIAYGRGGATETVVDGKTGLLFHEQTVNSLKEAIKKFLDIESCFDPYVIHQIAERFNKQRFKQEIKIFVEEKLQEWKKQNH